MEKTYVFDDQSVDCRTFTAEAFAQKEDIVLQRFLEKAYEVVKVENKGQIQHFEFSTIQELVDRYYNGQTKDSAIQNAVFSAAVASADSVKSLVPLAAESVRIAFRPTKMRKYLSTAVQAIVSEDVKGNTATVIAESDLADPKLFHVLAGHLVNGAGMCSSNLYADMAYTICHYAYSLLKPGEKVDINIGAMDNPAPLLLKNINEPEQQMVRITIKVDLDAKSADFTVTANNGKKDVTHAKSIIRFEDVGLWKEEWNRTSYLVQSRMDLLKHKMENGEANKVGRTTAYRLFGALVDYSDSFQGMHSVVFDGPEFEATSNIKFRAGPDDGDFYFNPYFLDGACHLSGFIVNATVNPQEECYINHGWSSLRFIAPLEHDQQYFAYVKMQLVPRSKMRVGDVYVFNSNKEVIGLAGGVRFQCIPRKLMNVIMPKPKTGGKTALSSAPVVKPTPVATSSNHPSGINTN